MEKNKSGQQRNKKKRDGKVRIRQRGECHQTNTESEVRLDRQAGRDGYKERVREAGKALEEQEERRLDRQTDKDRKRDQKGGLSL